MEQAAKQADIHFSTYYAGRRQLKLPKAKRKYIKRSNNHSPHVTLTVPDSNDKTVFFMGDKETLIKLVEKL